MSAIDIIFIISFTMMEQLKMRYFLVSYLAPDGFGSIWFEHSAFPNYKWLCLKISEGMIDDNIIIVNIFEFTNKEDFDDFKYDD